MPISCAVHDNGGPEGPPSRHGQSKRSRALDRGSGSSPNSCDGALDRLVKSRAGRLAHEGGHRVAADSFLPAQLEPGRRQDDRLIRVDITDVLDQRPSSLGVAAGPDIVNEDIGTLGEVAGPSGEDRAVVASRPTALNHLVPEATEGIGLLAGQVEVVMDDEDASALIPPRDAPRPVRLGRLSSEGEAPMRA
jgi:hypothetical protein